MIPADSRISVIFPIAGGSELGRTFRPFETVSGESLIHRSLRSFAPFHELIDKVYYVYLVEEETRFSVSARLAEIITDFSFEAIQLPMLTSGPAETVARGILQHAISGRVIVCDIDHRLDLEPLFRAITENDSSRNQICVWPLKAEDLKRWSVACLSKTRQVREVAERRLPEASGDFYGVIGCYYFTDIQKVAGLCLENGCKRFSEYLNLESTLGNFASAVHLEQAEFFGDKERIREIETGGSRFLATIFCDIDGTILEHEDVPSYAVLPRVLPGSRETLRRWADEGYCVILCTARKSEDEGELRRALEQLDLPFHRLICGLPSGPRVLINDRKPSAMFMTQALSLEITRNQGIHGIELPKERQPTVLKRFEGGSFAETLLLETEERRFVRKRATKHKNLSVGSTRLKAQYRTLERFGSLCPGIVPALYQEEENSHEYYYDMEFLEGYTQICDTDSATTAAALGLLFDQLNESVYSHQSRHPSLGEDWFFRHLDQKIYTKIDLLAENPRLRPLLIGEGVVLNGVHHQSLESMLGDVTKPETMRYFLPQFLSLVHGDLTFQNIMAGSAGSVKIIDMESTASLDAVELDMGKLFQSIHSQYETWSHIRSDLCKARGPAEIELCFKPKAPDPAVLKSVSERWSKILNCSEDLIALKASFYLGLHLIRMVPFRLKESEDQALYALATGLQQLNLSLANIRNFS